MSLHTEALATIIASYRSLADQLEELLATGETRESAEPTVTQLPVAMGAVFDPERDVPPVTPKVHGTREEEEWCLIIFFGRLRALNVRQGRGAQEGEQRAIGNAAGYKGRAGFNGWHWTWADREDGRWITDDDDLTEEDKAKGRASGMAFLRDYVQRRNVTLPEDLL